MNFSEEEQKKAQTPTIINYNITASNRGTIQIQQSTIRSSQSVIENQYDREIMTELLGLINQIQKKSELEIFTAEQKLEIKTIFESLQNELKSPKPKQSFLKKLCDQLIQKVPSTLSLILQFVELLDKLGIKT